MEQLDTISLTESSDQEFSDSMSNFSIIENDNPNAERPQFSYIKYIIEKYEELIRKDIQRENEYNQLKSEYQTLDALYKETLLQLQTLQTQMQQTQMQQMQQTQQTQQTQQIQQTYQPNPNKPILQYTHNQNNIKIQINSSSSSYASLVDMNGNILEIQKINIMYNNTRDIKHINTANDFIITVLHNYLRLDFLCKSRPHTAVWNTSSHIFDTKNLTTIKTIFSSVWRCICKHCR